LISSLLSTYACVADVPVKITIGAPHFKEFPATKVTSRSVYIEIPIKTTNTSKEAISFTTYIFGPNFIEYVRIKKNSKHWTDIGAKGMCGLSYSSMTLAPGESIDSTVLIEKCYSGKQFRLVLPVTRSSRNSKGRIRVASPTTRLP
jgi:hypothetical protein